ncbi:hypothetical protein CCP2SC5_840011 [Azospirillaceae bacterium]
MGYVVAQKKALVHLYRARIMAVTYANKKPFPINGLTFLQKS